MNTLDAVHFCYRNLRATEFVVTKFREAFPESSVSLIVDKGGLDFSHMACDRVSVFHFDDLNIGGTGESSYLESHRMKLYLDRWALAGKNLAAKYVMMLEDDVLVQSKFDVEKNGEFDFALSSNNFFPSHFKEKFSFRQNLSRWGVCGGTVIRRQSFLDLHEDWKSWISLHHDEEVNIFRPLGAGDCCMAFHFSRCGCTEKEAFWLNEGNVIHPWKNLYPPGWTHNNQIEW